MTGTQIMILIIIVMVIAGFCIGGAVGAWKQVQLARHGYREGRDGNITKVL